MKYSDLKNYYLCGIGRNGEVDSWRVGIYDSKRKNFRFSNGSYSPMELSKKPTGGNATYVISATPLVDIDDAGLLNY